MGHCASGAGRRPGGRESILDIKPYIPYADSHPGALEGFASIPAEALEVVIPPDLLQQIPSQRLEALRGVLAQDPRPRYQEDPQRVYGFGFAGMETNFPYPASG